MLLGAASGSVAALALTYVFEGFEQGVLPALADPVLWVWLAGFALGGAVMARFVVEAKVHY